MTVWIIFGIIWVVLIGELLRRSDEHTVWPGTSDDEDAYPAGNYVVYDGQGTPLHTYRNLDDALLHAYTTWHSMRANGHPYVVHQETATRFAAQEYETRVLPYLDDETF